MKKLFFVATLCIVIAACTKPAPPPPAPVIDSVGENNKALIARYTDVAVKGDTTTMSSFLTDNFKGFGPGLNDSTDHAIEISNWARSWRNEFSSIDFKRAGSIAFTNPADGNYPGDWVADWAVITVNYKDGKKPVTFWWHGVFRIKDGKIELSRTFYNVNDFFTQQGFTVTPPKAPAKKK
jgi:hypothetical protein